MHLNFKVSGRKVNKQQELQELMQELKIFEWIIIYSSDFKRRKQKINIERRIFSSCLDCEYWKKK